MSSLMKVVRARTLDPGCGSMSIPLDHRCGRRVKIALVGCGCWGRYILRDLTDYPDSNTHPTIRRRPSGVNGAFGCCGLP